MNIEYSNNLDNNTMTVTVFLQPRKKARQPRIKIGWPEVSALVEQNYAAPNTHTLGKCVERLKIADNEYVSQCIISWVFELHENIVQKKTIKKTTAAKKTSKSKTRKN